MYKVIILMILSMENSEDRDFIADLYSKYNKLMLNISCKYVKDRYYAEDIVQEAFIKLIKKISLLKTFKCCILTSYIVFTIESTALNFIKRRDRDSESAFLFDDDEVIANIPEEETPENIFFDKQESEKIMKAISKLRPNYKLILQCKYFQNMSDKQIAEILDIKPDSVREYLTRARKAAKKILEKEYDLNVIK